MNSSADVDVGLETNSSFLIGQNNMTLATLKGWIDEVRVCQYKDSSHTG